MSDSKNPLKAVAEKAAEAVLGREGPEDGVPGKPASASPPVAEPTTPHEPLPPKPDQTGPATVSPTGRPTGPARPTWRRAGPT
ncbi:Catalase OS=Streptomyces gougerotii OX=53448 GN=GCM10010227_03380 PE=3 SV=1 [Streptomyces diastaticus subsp. diastaticus]